MKQIHDYYECGMCLIMFQPHNNQTEHCTLCFKGLLNFEDIKDVYEYPLEDNKE
jgi:GGDEF domain-containing protein